MAKIDILKKLIREELRAVLREELPKILNERTNQNPNSYKNSVLESAKRKGSQVPLTLNTRPAARPQEAKVFHSNNPLAAMLNETATTMMQSEESAYFDVSEGQDGYSVMQNAQLDRSIPIANDATDMIRSSVPSSDVSMVQVNAVPDFNGLMDKLINKGVI
jgi:hypothetical protein